MYYITLEARRAKIVMMRTLPRGQWLPGILGYSRERKGENGTLTKAFAGDCDRATHHFNGSCAIVQAEAMAFLFRGKTVLEHMRKVVRRNSRTGI